MGGVFDWCWSQAFLTCHCKIGGDDNLLSQSEIWIWIYLFFFNFRHRQPCRSNPELASPPPTSSISSAQPVRGQDGGGTAHIAATYVLHSGAPGPAAFQLPALIQQRCGSTPTARTRALLHSEPPGELRTQSGPAGWPRTGRWSALWEPLGQMEFFRQEGL